VPDEPTPRGDATAREVDTARETADAVAVAVLACPAVVRLVDDGVVATFLPGRRVGGVRVDDDSCEVAVAVRADGRPIPEIAEQVRAAAATAAGDRAVDVLVADLVTADELAAEPGAEPAGSGAVGTDAGRGAP
jgi:hypothetical protein